MAGCRRRNRHCRIPAARDSANFDHHERNSLSAFAGSVDFMRCSPTRNAWKLFVQRKGITMPKPIMHTSGGEGKLTRKLALNLDPAVYPVASKIDHLMQQVGWFLPNNYILVPVSKRSELASGFYDM